MNQKRLAFVGFWNGFDPESFFLTRLIKERYDVVITDIKHADYVFFSVASEDHWKARDESVKIFFTGEMVTPDFNSCDYAIGFDWMEFGDRYFRLPLYYSDAKTNRLMESKHERIVIEDVKKKKTDFCSITVSNKKRDPIFKLLYEKLSKYKKVDSGGKWNNNIGEPVENKFSFDLTHKFSIVCENCTFPGYTTEKIAEAFAAGCIPIYWGDPKVTEVFNSKAFINVMAFSSVDEVVNLVKKIDADAFLYEKILREPVYNDRIYYYDVQIALLIKFLSNIFDPPIEEVRRRNRVSLGKSYVRLRRIQCVCTMPYFGYRFFRRICGKIYRSIV